MENLVEINKKINKVISYANYHIGCLTETILDYIDDDRMKNKDIIGALKEDREHWRDILRILENETTYIDEKEYL